jgi:1-acyl-sn-glycerol-3-phosphate acyltransferase
MPPAFATAAPLRLRHSGGLSLSTRDALRPPAGRASSRAVVRAHLRGSFASRAGRRAEDAGRGAGGGAPEAAAEAAGDGDGGGGGAAAGRAKHRRTGGFKRGISLLGIVKVFVTLGLSVPFFVPMVLLHPLVMLFDRQRRRFHMMIQMLWMQVSLTAVRIRVKVKRRENLPPRATPVVYVANHASYLDIFSIAFLGRFVRYLSKSEIFRLPVVGWSMFLTGNVGLKRTDRRGQMEAYKKMIDALAHGVSLAVYPEGTRSETGAMRKFKAGAFRAAKQAGVPVVPITITGTREIMPPRTWWPVAGDPITLTVHPAIDSSKFSVEELRAMSFEAISSSLPQPIS